MNQDLQSIASQCINDNLIAWHGKKYLAAGGHQYRAIWVRDAAYSVTGLQTLGKTDITKNHIDLYLDYVNEDGMGPKGFDTMALDQRVVWTAVRQVLGLKRKPFPFNENRKLIPVYKDSRRSSAIDSNLLILLSVFHCSQQDQDEYFQSGEIVKLFTRMIKYYDQFKNVQGLISQSSHTDWQDSQKRIGPAFLTNLLYCEVLKRFANRGIVGFVPSLPQLVDLVRDSFMCKKSGVFKSMLDDEQCVSLDGNLLALRWDFMSSVDETSKLWASLKSHPLWKGTACDNPFARTDCLCLPNKLPKSMDTGLPGFATYPDYPRHGAAWQVRFAGVQSYHDSLYWSWLMALSGEIAYRMGDIELGDRIAINLERLAVRDGTITEVYSHRPDFPMFKTVLFTSESPFSWGAAFALDMLASRGQPS